MRISIKSNAPLQPRVLRKAGKSAASDCWISLADIQILSELLFRRLKLFCKPSKFFVHFLYHRIVVITRRLRLSVIAVFLTPAQEMKPVFVNLISVSRNLGAKEEVSFRH